MKVFSHKDLPTILKRRERENTWRVSAHAQCAWTTYGHGLKLATPSLLKSISHLWRLN